MTETALAAAETDAETCTWYQAMQEVIRLTEQWKKESRRGSFPYLYKPTAAEQVLAAIEKGVGDG